MFTHSSDEINCKITNIDLLFDITIINCQNYLCNVFLIVLHIKLILMMAFRN